MLRGMSLTAMKRAASYFKRVWVASSSLREFHPGLMLDNVEDLVDGEVQGGEGNGAFSLCRRLGSVLVWSKGSVPPCTLP